MRKLRYSLLSEFGIDYNLRRGRFCAIGDDSRGVFSDFWWKETCRFENYLISRFPGHSIFVSDHIPAHRAFTIWPKENPPLDKLCESSVAYLETTQPDSCVVMAHPLGFKLGAGRIVFGPSGAWIDQDIAWWLIKECSKANIVLPGLADLLEKIGAVDVLETLPWLKESRVVRTDSQLFWEQVYSQRGLPRIGKADAEEVKGYRIGGEIVSRLSHRYWLLDENESCDVYISGSLPTHRIVKVECARKVCDRDFVEGLIRSVSGIDDTWAVRFSIFDDLTADNSYLGGIVSLPDHKIIVESRT